jgi:hypothetical protein
MGGVDGRSGGGSGNDGQQHQQQQSVATVDGLGDNRHGGPYTGDG